MAKKESKKKSSATGLSGWLSRVEFLIIGVLVLSFMIWAGSKCSSTKQEMAEGEERTEITAEISDEIEEDTLRPLTPARPVTTTAAVNNLKKYPLLYVTLENLNMRTAPHLDSALVARLPMNEEVLFLGKRTDFRQKINLGTQYAYEPWVYVQNRRGKKGWVYGAGVHYYKMNRMKEDLAPPPGEEIEE